MSETQRFEHAIVIGGSMAGLLAARVLADHFDRVTLVERDALDDAAAAPRKGVPQGRHAHGLLAQGQLILEQLFPGLVDDLVAAGATSVDLMADARWYQPGGYRARHVSQINGLSLSRPLLEAGIRRRVLALPNVVALGATEVCGLASSDDRAWVSGVIIVRRGAGGTERGAGGIETAMAAGNDLGTAMAATDGREMGMAAGGNTEMGMAAGGNTEMGMAAGGEEPPVERLLTADLVVDAGGRGSRAPAWLERLGYERPREERIIIDVGYTTRLFVRRPADLPDARFAVVQPTPPHEKRIGVLLPIEGERWIVTLGGWLGDHAPTDLAGFRAYARGLPASDIYEAIKTATPLDDGAVYRFPYNLRRRYEQVKQMPEGYVVIGDALCSFNPIYGQGMTVSVLEARELAACLCAAPGSLAGLPARFYHRAAAVIDAPWQMAAGADCAYPAVAGTRAPGTDLLNWYVRQVQRAATRDARTCRSLVEVTNLLAPPRALFAPHVLAWAMRTCLRRPARPDLTPAPAGEW